MVFGPVGTVCLQNGITLILPVICGIMLFNLGDPTKLVAKVEGN